MTPKKRKPGRPPLPPEVKAERKKQSSIGRRGRHVTIIFPTVEIADDVRRMLGGESWAKTMLAALILYTKPIEKDARTQEARRGFEYTLR